jgi:hypothetical protein
MVQRSPRPMIQIFDRNGQFIRRFGNDLESPRAICIDQQGRIIIIESKIMKGTDIYIYMGFKRNKSIFFERELIDECFRIYFIYRNEAIVNYDQSSHKRSKIK